jgi:acyl carrier protein
MTNEILNIVYEAISELNELSEKKIEFTSQEKTKLYGSGGSLDSLSLVNLIVLVEQKIEEKLNKSLVLADEKAFSQNNSPFATIDSLVEYIKELLTE